MKLKFSTLIFIWSLTVFAKDVDKCSQYERLVQDLQTVEMDLSSDQECEIGGKKQKCTLKDLQTKYNSLQAQNVLLFGVANLINQVEKNIASLQNPSEVFENNIQDLLKLQNGAIVFDSIKTLTDNNSKLGSIKNNDSDESIISNLKIQFCNIQSSSTNELCPLLNSSLTSDGKVKKDLTTQAILGYVKNYSLIQRDVDKNSVNDLVKKKLVEKQTLFESIPTQSIDNLIKEAQSLSNDSKCIHEAKNKPPVQPSISVITKLGADPNAATSEPVAKSLDCLKGKPIEEFKKIFADSIQKYNKSITDQVSKIHSKQKAENEVFEYVAGLNLIHSDIKAKFDNDYNCFSNNGGCENAYLQEALGKTPPPTNDQFNLAYQDILFNQNAVDSFSDFSNTSKFAQNADQCLGDDKKKCYISELTKQLQNLCNESSPKSKIILTENDVQNDHLKINKCLASINKDNLMSKIQSNSKEILTLQNQMKSIHNKKSPLAANPLYKDISYVKSIIFKKWEADCTSSLEDKALLTWSCDATNLSNKSPLVIFMDSNKKIISTMNQQTQMSVVQDRNYQFDNKNFCDPSYKNLQSIAELCANGLASFKTKTSTSTSTSTSNEAAGGGNQSGSSSDKKIDSDAKLTKDEKGKNNNRNNEKIYDRGESRPKGEAIGSGLLSSFKYGIDTWRNFNQIKTFNQGMMNNAYMVRYAELNPPHLSFNPAPNNYPPPMYTGIPLGSMNPYSSTFNYNNNSFYYNTYDPTKGTSLSNDTSYSFTP